MIAFQNDMAPVQPVSISTDKTTFSVVCRGSWLSLAQADIFRARVQQFFPHIQIKVVVRDTAGDKNQSTPLHLVEGQDFFTKDIQHSLQNGETDFALHSMKDVSSADFFDSSYHAIISRDAIHDVVVFNADIINRIKAGEPIRIGTSSPRRSVMATTFLQKALPQYDGKPIQLTALPIRGNVDVRLQKLHTGEYDGLVLAAAGLNRLLAYAPSRSTVQQLLQGKKLMVLPLFECPPAAGQGAIVAETSPYNKAAVKLLNSIKDGKLTAAVQQERQVAHRHGYGCSQPFGTFFLQHHNTSFGFAAGSSQQEQAFTEWHFATPAWVQQKQWLSTAAHMKEFFNVEPITGTCTSKAVTTLFFSSHKALNSPCLQQQAQTKQVWAAGTKTWYALAQQGIWVTGCADGLGLEFLQPLWQSPLFAIHKKDVQIVTNIHSAIYWQKEGWRATGTYAIAPTYNPALIAKLQQAEAIFWTSFQQYRAYRQYARPTVLHGCPAGKTATLLRRSGITPVVFPTIKAFSQWKQ